MRLKTAVARGVTAGLPADAARFHAPLAALVGTLLWVGFDGASRTRTWARLSRLAAGRRRRTAYRSYARMARSLVEFLHTPKYSDAEILERVTLDNESALDEALEGRRGAILLSGHFGNWEWLARRVAAQAIPSRCCSRSRATRSWPRGSGGRARRRDRADRS